MRRAATAYLFLSGLSVLQVVYYYPKLPATVASHFGAAGKPNGWASKGVLAGLDIGMVLLLAATFLSIDILIARIPDSLVHMPNKDYWLAPERKKQTHAAVSSFMLWMGCATIVFLLAVFQLLIQANLSEDRTLGVAIWVFLGLYAVFTVVWLARFLLRFVRVPG